MKTAQVSPSLRLSSHPSITRELSTQTEATVDGWLKTTVLAAPEQAEMPLEILASVRQTLTSKTQVELLQEKGGIFGLVHADDLVYIALPGSFVQLPDTELEMFGPPSAPPSTMRTQPAHRPERTTSQTVTDQAMILGAGLASRFVPVSGDVTGYAKPSVPLVGEDSVIVTLAKHLQKHGIRKIFVNTFYKPGVLKAQLSSIEGIEFIYIDEDQPSGTAGGLLKALEQGLVDTSKPMLIMQGDAVTDADLSSLLETHASVGALTSIALKQVRDEDVSKMAIVETQEANRSGPVHSFIEKPSLEEAGESRLGSIGFYVLSPQVFPHFQQLGRKLLTEKGEFDYAYDFFPSILQQQRENGPAAIYGKLLEEPFYWSDIGRPDQYLATVRDVYTGQLRIDLPKRAEQFWEDGMLFWPGTRERAQAQNAHLKGNVIVTRKAL